MKQRVTPIRIAASLVIVLAIVGLFAVQQHDSSKSETQAARTMPIESKAQQAPGSPPIKPVTPDHEVFVDAPPLVAIDPGERWRTADIEEFKEALYEIEIESVDDLHNLEQFVQIGDADTRDFWNTDWAGVDDWKREQDGFRLDQHDDGTLVFVPGDATKQIYSFFETENVYEYDDVTQEFIYEVDYYGKSIINIVKFLREDVMVMMVVSGQKVDMNIYQLNDEAADY